jgi:hypothetical protein
MITLAFYLCTRYDDLIVVTKNVVTTKRKFTQSGELRTRTEAELRGRAIASTDASMAVAFLNSKKSRAVVKVLEIQQELANLVSMADGLRSETLQSQSIDAQHKHLAHRQIFVDRLLKLNRRLATYSFVPMLACTSFDTYEWRYQAVPKSPRGPVVPVSDGTLTVAVNDSQAVVALARLFGRGELHTVHKCDNCGTWHVAARSIDRFCSKECREKWHTKSPNYAAKRREIQRNYRRNVNLKIAAEDAKRKRSAQSF